MAWRRKGRSSDEDHGAEKGPKEGPTPAPAGHGSGHRGSLLALSFGALGVIYGDIGTSPLYAFQAVLTAPPPREEVLAAASLFVWTLTLIVLVKYVAIVLRFDDNGEGGTFALYSLICRAAGFTAFGPTQLELAIRKDPRLLSALPHGLRSGHCWSLHTPRVGAALRAWYRRSAAARTALLVVVTTATAMVAGDGLLTPSISVLSAITGLRVARPSITQPTVIGITVAVLVVLFSIQRYGTGKVSLVFAPIIMVWMLLNTGIGIYNLTMCGWSTWQAVSPHWMFRAFTGSGGFESGWRLLAGVMLCITGAEAMYADLGHFNDKAVMLSFCTFVYPCLLFTYMGQAAYLLKHPEAYTDPFWHSVPRPAFYPMLIVATLASVVASQALISGVFSIMRQAMNLGLLPRLKITHTDEVMEGQIYIGQINFMLLIGCIGMVVGFQNTTRMGHAYGVAVITVMWITTFLVALVMLVCYDINPALVTLFLVIFVPLEGLFLSSNAIKIPEGGWVTLVFAALFATIKLTWWYGSLQKRIWMEKQASDNMQLLHFPLDTPRPSEGGAGATPEPPATPASDGGAKGPSGTVRLASTSAPVRRLASMNRLVSFNNQKIERVPGLAIMLTRATSGIPAVLRQLLVNLPALPRVAVLTTLKFVPMPYVTDEERFMVKTTRIPGVYRVVLRYGYMEEVNMDGQFVRQLVGCLVKHTVATSPGGASAGDIWCCVAMSCAEADAMDLAPPSGSEIKEENIECIASRMAAAPSSPTAAVAGVTSPPAIPRAAGQMLGRESVNRSQYRRLRRAHTLAGGEPYGITSGATTPANTPALSFAPTNAQIAAAPARGGAGGGKFAPAQLERVSELLECYSTRAVFIAGGTRVKVAAAKRACCRNPLRTGVLALYRFLENNTEPAVLTWRLPDDQLLELTMTARV